MADMYDRTLYTLAEQRILDAHLQCHEAEDMATVEKIITDNGATVGDVRIFMEFLDMIGFDRSLQEAPAILRAVAALFESKMSTAAQILATARTEGRLQ